MAQIFPAPSQTNASSPWTSSPLAFSKISRYPKPSPPINRGIFQAAPYRSKPETFPVNLRFRFRHQPDITAKPVSKIFRPTMEAPGTFWVWMTARVLCPNRSKLRPLRSQCAKVGVLLQKSDFPLKKSSNLDRLLPTYGSPKPEPHQSIRAIASASAMPLAEANENSGMSSHSLMTTALTTEVKTGTPSA